MAPMPVELSAVKFSASDEMEAYERLLADAMKGDQLLFVRQDAVEAQWAIVEPILGDCCPVQNYEPGTLGPAGLARAGRRRRRLARSGVGDWENKLCGGSAESCQAPASSLSLCVCVSSLQAFSVSLLEDCCWLNTGRQPDPAVTSNTVI